VEPAFFWYIFPERGKGDRGAAEWLPMESFYCSHSSLADTEGAPTGGQCFEGEKVMGMVYALANIICFKKDNK